jgi:metal-sulfur cluster biosynthetic enzyme
MATEEQVRQSLEAVVVPAVKRSIVGMNLVREVTTSDKKVNVTPIESKLPIKSPLAPLFQRGEPIFVPL